MRLLACLLLATALAGCVYKMDIQQGNYVTQDVVDKLKPGMTKAEVRNLLGTPLLVDIFHDNEWDYYLSDVRGGKARDRKRLTVYFENGKLARFTGNANPPPPPPVRAAAPARPVQ